VSCAFGTGQAASGCRDKLRVFPIERRIFQDEQDVPFNPHLKLADWQQDALGLLICARPFFPEASVEGFFLLCGLKSCQQQSMAYADLVFGKGFHHNRGQFGQFQSSSAVGWRFAHLCGDLLDAGFRFLQVEEGAETLSFLQRVNVFPLKVFDLSLVLQKLSMTSTTMESCTL
jgi:hypothetical protein